MELGLGLRLIYDYGYDYGYRGTIMVRVRSGFKLGLG